MESLNPHQKPFDECFKNKRQRSIDGSAISKPRDAESSSSSSAGKLSVDIVMSHEKQQEQPIKDTMMSGGSYGSISVIGRRRVMKDAVAVMKLNGHHFFAVYDGHGGSSVSAACRDSLHHLLANEVEPYLHGAAATGAINWPSILTSSFSKMDNEGGGGGTVDVEGSVNTVGTSAVVAVVGKEEIVVANSGNSRAVLCRDGVAVPLSREHKPDRPDEKQRVEAAGGRVIEWKGSRMLGLLSTSRSIGDHYLKPYVISEPEVLISPRTEVCYFMVIASDGLWDVVSNEFACQVVSRCLEPQIKRRYLEGVGGGPALMRRRCYLSWRWLEGAKITSRS